MIEVKKNRGFKKRREKSGDREIQDERSRGMKQRRRRFCHF